MQMRWVMPAVVSFLVSFAGARDVGPIRKARRNQHDDERTLR